MSGGPVDPSEPCRTRWGKCRCGKCAICGYHKHMAIHQGIVGSPHGVRSFIHEYVPVEEIIADYPVSDRWIIYCIGCNWATFEDTNYLGRRMKAHIAAGCEFSCLAVFQDGRQPGEVNRRLYHAAEARR